jgi:hypothetical protein
MRSPSFLNHLAEEANTSGNCPTTYTKDIASRTETEPSRLFFGRVCLPSAGALDFFPPLFFFLLLTCRRPLPRRGAVGSRRSFTIGVCGGLLLPFPLPLPPWPWELLPRPGPTASTVVKTLMPSSRHLHRLVDLLQASFEPIGLGEEEEERPCLEKRENRVLRARETLCCRAFPFGKQLIYATLSARNAHQLDSDTNC